MKREEIGQKTRMVFSGYVKGEKNGMEAPHGWRILKLKGRSKTNEKSLQ